MSPPRFGKFFSPLSFVMTPLLLHLLLSHPLFGEFSLLSSSDSLVSSLGWSVHFVFVFVLSAAAFIVVC